MEEGVVGVEGDWFEAHDWYWCCYQELRRAVILLLLAPLVVHLQRDWAFPWPVTRVPTTPELSPGVVPPWSPPLMVPMVPGIQWV